MTPVAQLWRFQLLGLLIMLAVSQIPCVLSLTEEGQLLLQWKQNLGVGGSPLANWNAADATPCHWTGVNCSLGSSVTGINLNNFNINGSFSQGIFGKFANLTSLDVGYTNLNGLFPADIVNCSKLVYLDLHFTPMGGEVPQDISKLKLLQHLDISYAFFNGTIPATIGEFQELVYLGLCCNNFVGEVPASIGALQKLQTLTLEGNNFLSGVLPASIFELQNLREFSLGANNFTLMPMPSLTAMVNMERLHFWSCNFTAGLFPPAVAGMTKLLELQLSSCNISGPIPAFLETLTLLEVINLDGNSLNGSIPDIFGGMRNLSNLSVQSNMLTGSLPPSLWQCTKLTTLSLFANFLVGGLPAEIGNLMMLTLLDVSQNNMTGPIPPSLGNLTQIKQLGLFMNNFSGEIPPGVADWVNLTDFSVFQNQITGTIPYNLGSNAALQSVDFTSNFLEGPIPPYLCRSGQLQVFHLSNNKLTGGIPETYGNCTTLTRVSLYNNKLEGPVPVGLWGGNNLFSISLYNNSLNGSIAPTIGQSTSLALLMLEENNFSGPIPGEIGTTSLSKFRAYGNNFSGDLPEQLGSLSNLTELFLYKNSFSGSIPPAIGRCDQLVQLDLSDNHLQGIIPPQLADLTNLNNLNLADNELTGFIPAALFSLVQLQDLNVAYNNLSGVVPSAGNGQSYVKVNITGNPHMCEEGACNATVPASPADATSGRSKKIAWVVGVTFAAAALVLLVGSFLFVHRYKSVLEAVLHGRRGGDDDSWTLTSFQKRTFQEYEVTDLDEDNLIGSGGSGKVYKATLTNGDAVAVKKLWGVKRDDRTHDHGFNAEVSTLGSIRHRHIVKLLCCCTKRDANLLVYEYMPNGSLGELLHSTKGSTLTWRMRYKIALGAAMGLEYLHHDCTPQILHRDVKSNNILLDADYEAHLADFGIAKIVEPTATDVMSTVAGSLGYIAPEYAYSLKVDEKSDIYSFGVVLLELVTGKRAVDPAVFGDGADLVHWVCNKVQTKEGLLEVLDPNCGTCAHDDMILFLRVGMLCASFMPMSRPSMREVVMMLKIAEPKPDWNTKAKDGSEEGKQGRLLEISVLK